MEEQVIHITPQIGKVIRKRKKVKITFFKRKEKKRKDEQAEQRETLRPVVAEKKVFEDAFMDIQEGLLALCMEFAEDVPVDEVFAYGSIETDAYSFNAFYVKDGQVLTTNKINVDLPTIREFLQIGGKDLVKLEKLCKEYGRPTPTELRLHYTVDGGHLDTHYEYESVCGPESGISPTKVFLDWRESVGEELRKKQ